MDTQNMGKFNSADDSQIKQWYFSYPAHLHGAPVYLDGVNGPTIYYWPEYERLKAHRYDPLAKQLLTTPVATSAMYVPPGMPGAALSISANGKQDGIVWAAHPYDDDAIHKIVPGIIRAFDARDLTEIWNSKMVPERDDIGLFAKFTPPTIANGKVYVASFSNEVSVYGIAKWVTTPDYHAG